MNRYSDIMDRIVNSGIFSSENRSDTISEVSDQLGLVEDLVTTVELADNPDPNDLLKAIRYLDSVSNTVRLELYDRKLSGQFDDVVSDLKALHSSLKDMSLDFEAAREKRTRHLRQIHGVATKLTRKLKHYESEVRKIEEL